MPGTFNMACSTIYDGSYAGVYTSEDLTWDDDSEKSISTRTAGLSDAEARDIIRVALLRCGTAKQQETGVDREIESREYMNLEVSGVKMPSYEQPPVPEG